MYTRDIPQIEKIPKGRQAWKIADIHRLNSLEMKVRQTFRRNVNDMGSWTDIERVDGVFHKQGFINLCTIMDMMSWSEFEIQGIKSYLSVKGISTGNRRFKEELIESFIDDDRIDTVIRVMQEDTFTEEFAVKEALLNVYGIKRAKALEATFEDIENIEIYTADSTIVVFTDTLTWELIAKVKIMSYELLKEDYEDSYNTKEKTEFSEFWTAFSKQDTEKVNEIITKVFKHPKIIEKENENIKKYFTPNIEEMLYGLKSRMYEADNQAAQYVEHYTNALKLVNNLKAEYNALSQKEINENTGFEVIDYLKTNQFVTSVNAANSNLEIRIIFEAPLNEYDKNALQTMWLDSKIGEGYALMHALFLEDRYELWAKTIIIFNTSTFLVSPANNVNHDNTTMPEKSLIKHPHIHEWRCFGNHEDAIEEWATTSNYIGALDQATMAVLNFNFTDTVVTETLISWIKGLIGSSRKTIYDTESEKFVTGNEVMKNITHLYEQYHVNRN